MDPTTTLGDMLVRGAAAITRLAVGADGQVLAADHTQLNGIKWAAATGTGGVPTTRQIIAGPGLSGGGTLGGRTSPSRPTCSPVQGARATWFSLSSDISTAGEFV